MFYAQGRYKQKIFDFIIEGEKAYPIKGSIYGEWQKTGECFNKTDVFFVQPCIPSKIIAVGLNYKKHAKEMGIDFLDLPKNPIIFMKPTTTLIGQLYYLSRGCRKIGL